MTMNILQLEDTVKGLPDEVLMQQAQNPTGEIPQFLTISEIRRRSDMRERFQAQQDQPQGTIADQVIQKGLASMQPQGYAGGGEIQAPRWWERMLPMASPDTMYRDVARMSQRSQPSMRDQMGGVADIRMQIADIQSQGMTPDVDEQGNPVIVWEDGKPRVVVNGQPYGYAQGGIVSLQVGGDVPSPRWWERMLPMANPSIVARDMASMSREDMQRLLFGGGYDAAPDVEAGLQIAPDQQAFTDAMDTPVPGGKEVQGASPIQSQAMGLEALMATPSLPSREHLEYPSMAGQREGLAALGAETRDMYERMAKEQRGSNIDVSDLIEGGKKDAWASAMVQIGAGIARNDLAGGLEQAGETGHDAAKQARKLELWSRIQQAENDAKARELYATGQLSEQEYRQAVLKSEASEDLGRAQFEFDQRKADVDEMYKIGSLAAQQLNNKINAIKLFAELGSMAAQPGADMPMPAEGETIYELASDATGLWKTIGKKGVHVLSSLGIEIDEPWTEAGQSITTATADLIRSLAINPRFPQGEMERIRDEINILPGLTGEGTLRKKATSIGKTLETRMKQADRDASDPTLPDDIVKAQAANAAAIRRFLPQLAPWYQMDGWYDLSREEQDELIERGRAQGLWD